MKPIEFSACLFLTLWMLFPSTGYPADSDNTQFMVVHEEVDSESIKAASGSSQSDVRIIESFRASDKTFTVFEAATLDDLNTLLASMQIVPLKVTQILDINSPVRGGGSQAGDQPRRGHQTFMIQRKVPGVGYFPDEKKQAISKGSNAAIAKIGDTIEWDHSYLTDQGTFCVYRATDEETIRKHGAMIGPEILGLDVVQEIDLAEAN